MSPNNVVDIVIVTALPIECDAVLRYLESPQEVRINNRIVYQAYLQHEDSKTGYQVVVLCFGGMGNVQSATAVTQAINDWKPTAIILTGIMAGFEASERFLGDLIIPDEIVGYELAKLTISGTERRVKGLPTTHEMIQKSSHFQNKNKKWVLDNRIIPRPDQQSGRVNPQVHFGVVASGEKVMADKIAVQELQNLGYKLIGVEMEGFGTALAVHQADYSLKMLMVKGISDWADPNKNDLWRDYAANVAAAYVVNFLKSKPIECRVLPNSLNRTRRTLLQLVGFAGLGLVGAVVHQSLGNKSSFLKTVQFETVTVNSKGEITKRSQSQAQVFTETIAKGITLEMMAIPGGSFVMGSPDTEAKRLNSEWPQRTVNVAAFLMGKYEVTQTQWRAVVGLPKVNIDLNANPSKFKGDDLPVEKVTWDDAIEFCARLSRLTKRNYRLPSEAEWEYACRAGTTTPFYFGDTVTPDLVNYNWNSPYASAPKGTYRVKTIAVGSFGPNTFGLFDMHGNVWEWCQDVWRDNYNGAPTDGIAWESGGDRKNRVLRGGSWGNPAAYSRAAYRGDSSPDTRDDSFGFRVVCATAWTS